MSLIVYTTLQSEVQQVLVSYLREFFSNIDQFTWNENSAISKINITVEMPTTALQYPCVIIGNATEKPLIRTIGSQIKKIVTSEVVLNGVTRECISGYVYGGPQTLRIKLYTAANNTAESRKLKDYLVMFFTVVYRDKLAEKSITLIDVNVGADEKLTVGNNNIVISSLDISVFTEWRAVESDISTITSITVSDKIYQGE